MLAAVLLTLQVSLGSLAVVDGDTLHDNGRNQDYRLYGVDAPETTGAGCEAERALGHAAAWRAYELLSRAVEIRGVPGRDPGGQDRWPRDGFGRRLGRIEMLIDGEWVDLGEALVTEGLARPYSGNGPRPDWCTAS
jgi:endonuclease YncB( thermonuclease family)